MKKDLIMALNPIVMATTTVSLWTENRRRPKSLSITCTANSASSRPKLPHRT